MNFQSQLPNTDWSFIYNSDNIDASVAFVSNILRDLSDANFPLIQCSRKTNKDRPWINDELKKSIKFKNNLYFKFKQSNNKDDELIYKEYRNKLEKEIDAFRKKYFKDLFDICCNSVKGIWKALNNLCNYENPNKKSTIGHLTTSKYVIAEHSEIAEEFNRYFVDIRQNLSSAFSSHSTDYVIYLYM